MNNVSASLNKAMLDHPSTRFCALGVSQISHLLFVDGILVFCNESKNGIKSIMEALQTFELVAGMKFNKDKSSVFLSSQIHPNQSRYIQRTTGIEIAKLLTKYLGNRLFINTVKKVYFEYIITKIPTMKLWVKLKHQNSL